MLQYYSLYVLLVIHISMICVHYLSANDINFRPVRSLGDMHAGNSPGGAYGANNFGPSDQIRNPERPQLESIYRGKVIWGDMPANGSNKHDDYIYQKGGNPDIDTDKFGNPIYTSEERRRRPRPKLNPLRKEHAQEDVGRQKRGLSSQELHMKIKDAIQNNAEHLTPDEQSQKFKEFKANEEEINQLMAANLGQHQDTAVRKSGAAHMIQKRGLVQSQYTGAAIESKYKGPVIESRYKGPVVLSMYTGPVYRAQYNGPVIKSEYKGQVISCLGGEAHMKKQLSERAHVGNIVKPVETLAQKYEKMNKENNMAAARARYVPRSNAAVGRKS